MGIAKIGVYKFLPTQGYRAYWQGQQVSLRIIHIAEATFIVSTSGENVLDTVSAVRVYAHV